MRVWETRNVQKYYIFRASSFAKFVCRPRKWQPLCIAKITRNTRKTRANRRSFLGKKKRKEELQREEIMELGAILSRCIRSRDYPKKKLVSNYLVRMHLRFYANFCSLIFQSKVLCEEEKKWKNEWTIIGTKSMRNFWNGEIYWAWICSQYKTINSTKYVRMLICKSA